jgi:hypothetical protein
LARTLVRAGKSPLTPLSAEQSLTTNRGGVFGTNPGNMMFYSAMWRILSVPGDELVPDGYACERPNSARLAARINAEFDRLVIPLANAFRPTFMSQLQHMSDVIEKLTIPVSVVGVGAQSTLEGDAEFLSDDDKAVVKRFVSATLDRSPSIGVRGEYTEGVLARLGFTSEHVEVVGCPSMFGKGMLPPMKRKVERLDASSDIVINYTPSVAHVGRMVNENAERYPKSVVIPQTVYAYSLMVWGEQYPVQMRHELPEHLDHPLYKQGRMRGFLDARTWIEYLSGMDFVFGTRIHGNVAGVLAGTPSVVVAHDSRTLELARYHGIPHITKHRLIDGVDAQELYESADFDQLARVQPEVFERFRRFMDRNQIPNIFQPGKENPEFDRALADTPLPPPVTPLTADGEEGRRNVAERLAWLRQGFDLDRHRGKYAHLRPFPGSTPAPDVTALFHRTKVLEQQVAALRGELKQTRALVEAAAQKPEPVIQRALRRVARLLRIRPGR